PFPRALARRSRSVRGAFLNMRTGTPRISASHSSNAAPGAVSVASALSHGEVGSADDVDDDATDDGSVLIRPVYANPCVLSRNGLPARAARRHDVTRRRVSDASYAGSSACRGSASAISNHGAFDPTKMWHCA